MNIEFVRNLMIEAQDDLLRMAKNAKLQEAAEKIIGNECDAKFYSGSIKAFEYACKHLTNILEKTE